MHRDNSFDAVNRLGRNYPLSVGRKDLLNDVAKSVARAARAKEVVVVSRRRGRNSREPEEYNPFDDEATQSFR